MVAFNALGQIEPIKPKWNEAGKVSTRVESDSIPEVYDTRRQTDNTDRTAFFINDQFVSGGAVPIINPAVIEKLDVIKDFIELEGSIYESQIRIAVKSDYFARLISLNNLRSKYTNLNQQTAIFTVDGHIVNADYDKFLIDENHILSITIEKMDKVKGGGDLNFVRLLTRSSENMKKNGGVRIRGAKLQTNILVDKSRQIAGK